MSKCTELELEEIMAKPEYSNRVAVRVYEDGAELVTEWDGQEIRAENMWQLDSRLDTIVPSPRNLFLMESPNV